MFLSSRAKKSKDSLDWSSWESTGSLAIEAFNALAGYRCLDQTLTGPQPGNRVPQLRRKGYWMRESVFGTLGLDLDRTRAINRPVPQPVEPVGQSLNWLSLLASKTYLFQFISFLTLRQGF